MSLRAILYGHVQKKQPAISLHRAFSAAKQSVTLTYIVENFWRRPPKSCAKFRQRKAKNYASVAKYQNCLDKKQFSMLSITAGHGGTSLNRNYLQACIGTVQHGLRK
jgi:hypothetical protein